MPDGVALFVGTNKGGFVLTSDAAREKWEVSGPHMRGSSIDHMAYDRRDGTILMAINHDIYGPEVARSTDFGETWERSEKQPRFVYMGAAPASL